MGELFGLVCPFYRAGDAGTEYELADGRFERFAPSAFERTLSRRRDVRCDLLHNGEIRLGYTSDGTVRLWTDAAGLWCSVRLTGAGGAYVRELVAGRTLRGASVSFYPRASRSFTVGGKRVLEHLDVDLVAFSPVASPAYLATTVTVRGAPLEVLEGEML
ncbi:Caudovirus prohead protease [Gemmata obscuriglobus]|uniref:Prohead serine protease domain-containing protein n=1 Tax=Gemmata obscuriglobus TaxID=114 RepID=A0A2Z3H7B5_9BACT